MSRGFGVIEVIVAVSLFASLGAVGVATLLGSFATNRQNSEYAEATLYAASGLEAARSLRNQGWSSPFLQTDCSNGCGVTDINGYWEWSGSNTTQDGFTRVIRVLPAQRNGSTEFVTSGGVEDADVVRVESEVSWQFTPQRSLQVTLVSYLANFMKAVIGDWSDISLLIDFDLSAANSGNATANVNALNYWNNYLFAGRTNSNGTELVAIDFTALNSPSLCANCQRQLLDTVNDIEIWGDYAYMATDNDAQELQVIDISDPSNLSSAGFGSLNLTNANSGSANGNLEAVEVSNGSLFGIRAGGDEFLEFDISTPLSPSIAGSGNQFQGSATGMEIVGDYAYVTSAQNNAEIQIMSTGDYSRAAVVDMNSGNNNANATAVFYAGNDVLLVGRQSSTAPELYAYDISSPTAPSLLSTVEIGTNVDDISYAHGYIYLVTDDNAEDFLVIDASDFSALPALPALASIDVPNTPFRLFYSSEKDAIFVGGANNSAEISVITPN
ncbi:hypothetical protein LRY65_01940 [Candidatus Woesebacteria bacterium]|nr:hypothetical protein [Candidatus Woesebacteria bacterium]MCD8526953.1 hypothetical protein [Candidatus Woesebacteria bacterium]MCD8545852.1 hypothetical protein [Candidatus Woesebacteria bacterium]